ARGPLGAPGPRAAVDRLDDALVAGAPAQVRGDDLLDLLPVRLRLPREEPLGEHEEAGGAETALQGVVFGERPLQVVEFAGVGIGEGLDGGDRRSLRLRGEHQAGPGREPVDEYRAGPADAVLATDVGTGQPQVVPEHVHQGAARLGDHFVLRAVDVEGEQLDVVAAAVGVVHGVSCGADAVRARWTVSGVMGVSSSSTPVGRSASLTALSTAAGAPMVPPSPAPLAPVSVNADGVCRWWRRTSGISWAVGTL